jgi:hypothetical protein
MGIQYEGGHAMLDQILPRRVDNMYRGHKLAIVVLGLIVLMKAAISLGSIFNGYDAASSADGIPLDSYTPAGARTVVSLFALLGLANFSICLIGMLVLVRYRSLVPFMLALLLVQHVGRYLILQALPIARTGTPPGSSVNLGLLGAMVVGLTLSLWSQRNPRPAAAVTG